MNKRDNLTNPNSCLNKAAALEPIFVLRAKDPLAPMTIRHWVTMNVEIQPQDKLQKALNLAEEMEEWYRKNSPQASAEEMPIKDNYPNERTPIR